jgi:tetratricopeptide (TPR) repeat protein
MVNVRAFSKPLMGEISGSRVVILALVLVLCLALALALALSFRQSEAPGHATGVTADALVRFYQNRLERDPADFISYNRLAEAFVRRARESGDVSDYARAEAAVTQSLSILPETHNFQALVVLGGILNAKHEFEVAADAGQKAITQKPNSAQGYAIVGDALIALGRYEEARINYLSAAELEPGLGTYSRMARIHELDGDLIAAEAAWWNAHRSTFRAAAENSAWVHVQLGDLYFNQGDLDRADEQYNQALSESEGYPHALAGLGKTLAANGRFSESVESYRRAIDQIPSPEYVIALGDVYSVWQKTEDAEQQYALVSAIDRLYLESGINTDIQMAKFIADHGVPSEAVARARAAHESRPNIYSSDALAWALYQASNYTEALTHSRDALRLGTQDALMAFHAGMIRFHLGDVDGAEYWLHSALEINPHFSLLHGDLAQTTLDEIIKLNALTSKGTSR